MKVEGLRAGLAMSSLVAFVLSIFSEDERGNSEKCNAKQRIWGKTTRSAVFYFLSSMHDCKIVSDFG